MSGSSRWRAVLIPLISVLAIVIAVVTFALGTSSGSHASRKATESARLAVCLQHNSDQMNTRRFQKALSRQNADIISPKPRSAQAQAAVVSALKIDDALVDRYFKLRNCSPSAIAAFYAVTTTTSH